jgi:hypothetical protein
VSLSGRSRRKASTQMEFQSIEPAFLTALAERAMQEEKRIQNPYLKALMVRLGRLALELKVALEKEGGLDRSEAEQKNRNSN